MISIRDKSKCCGCQACGDACPKDAISFKTDEEGFWYPEIDKLRCSDCGLCDKACPLLNLDGIRKRGQHDPVVYGGHHKNIAVRFDSTSGGVFSALANAMYRQGGHVSGAVQNPDFTVSNFMSSSKRDLPRLRSSKYVQSSAAGLYRKIAALLKSGEKVLACGSPCQMAALRAFLGRDYDNLIIVDFICRAANSPKAYRKYLDWLETKYGSKIASVKAKNKDHGWRSLARKVVFENGEVYYGETRDDPYRRGYHLNFYERPACHDCKFKGFPRVADITLGDFWGIEKLDGSIDHDLGTSCVLLNTDKGERFFDIAKDKLETRKFSLEDVLAGNREPLMVPVAYPAYDRAAFFSDMDKMPFDALAEEYFPLVRPGAAGKASLLRKVRHALGLVKAFARHPIACVRLVRWNVFCGNVDADFMHGRIFEVERYCAFDFRGTARISIGGGRFRFGMKKNRNSRLETRLFVDDGGRFEIERNGYVGSGADIQVFKNAVLRFGKDIGINSGLQIVCADAIEIGDGTRIGRDVWIRDNNGEHYIIQPGYTWKSPVRIGANCWIGSRAMIMKGVTIGEGTVIAANSVVVQSLPAHCIASGNPAQVVAENIVWRP